MTKKELKSKIREHNIPESWYSLNEGLKSDCCILHYNYTKWEYFYLDEKGNRRDYKIFTDEFQAYDYLWNRLQNMLNFYEKYR